MRRRTRALLAAVIVAGLIGTLHRSAGPREAVPIGSGLSLLGPARTSDRVDFTLLLRMPGARRLPAALAALEDPGSPGFHRFLGPRAFGKAFGMPTPALARLEAQLRDAGLRVTATYPQRTALSVRGTVATVNRLLGVTLAAYAGAGGIRSHAPLGAPSLPPSLRSSVSGVTGLDTRPLWHGRDVPLGGLTPQLAARAYDTAPLAALGIGGQGQRIAVISFSDYNHSEPRAFAQHFGIGGPEPRIIRVDGGIRDRSGSSEANLDIDVIRSVAPQAQVLVYLVPQTSSGYTDAINRIVADRSADIISTSWGQCELGLSGFERAGDSQALAAADAAGVSMFAASGDAGAYDCQQGDLPDHRLSVDWPAASAGVVAVGGTRLYVGPDGTYQKEAAWEDALSARGGGGGVTTGDRRPPWQTGPGVLGRYSNGRRQIPDVAADADPGTGWFTYSDGSTGEAGGTSAAAPFWAAAMALIRQYAASQGAGRLGYVNPALYSLTRTPQPFPPFHDVTLGGNRYYQAAPGWDPATGLGSPDVWNLARDMAAYLQTHPAR